MIACGIFVMLQLAKFTAIFVVVALLFAPVAAKANQEAVDEIMEQVKFFISDDNELEACRLVMKLHKYQETEAYDAAKAELLRYGISIEAPLDSYTVKVMVKLQNKLEKSRAKTGMMPRLGPRNDVKDAWGNPVRVEFISSEGYHYVIRSAGADKRFFTHDDPVLGTRNQRDRNDRLGDTGSKTKKPAGQADAGQDDQGMPAGAGPAQKVEHKSRDVGRSSLMHGRRPTEKKQTSNMDALLGTGPNAPAEREITLEELQETIGN